MFIQYLPHALAGGFPQFCVHDTHASRGGIAICTIALPLHTLVPQLVYLTRHVLEPVYSSICQYESLYMQYIQVSAGMTAPAHALESLWGVQDRVHLLGAPHGPYGVCGLTDDGMGSHFLAYYCCIAAQEHWKWGHVRAGVPLAGFVHVTSVDFPILALLACRIHLFKLSVLLASRAGRSQQLLDRVVQGAVEEHHALSTISRLG